MVMTRLPTYDPGNFLMKNIKPPNSDLILNDSSGHRYVITASKDCCLTKLCNPSSHTKFQNIQTGNYTLIWCRLNFNQSYFLAFCNRHIL